MTLCFCSFLLIPSISSSLSALEPSSPSSLDIEWRLPTSPALSMLHQPRSDALSSAVARRVQRPSTLDSYLLDG